MEPSEGPEYRYPKHRGSWVCRTKVLSCYADDVKALLFPQDLDMQFFAVAKRAFHSEDEL